MDGVAQLILPARGAAQKAAASIAEQLSDSPGRSDVDSPSSSNPFREPAHRTKSVKYRYTATGKHLSSPLKGSFSSPERKLDKPKKSKLTTLVPASPSHVPKGKGPAVATTSTKRKASATSLRREDRLNSMFTSSPSPLSSVPSSPIAPINDLPPSPTPTAHESIADHPQRLSISKTFSLHSFGTTASKSGSLSRLLSPKRRQKKGRTNTRKGVDPWDIGNSVWVLVDQSGALADNNARPESVPESPDSFMWWPAQVVQKQPLRVSMFGDFPSSSSSNRGLCTIFTPSSSNILSINDDSGAKRFSRTTFRLTSLSIDDDVCPPTKKPRLDDVASMEARWESAVQSMDKASTLEKDGLPALLSTYATTGASFYDSLDDSDDPDTPDVAQSLRRHATTASKTSKPTESTRKPKPQRSKAISKADVKPPRRLPSPCHPDPTLQIPGELILALAPRTGGAYWPAQILEHFPSYVKEKYKVKFLDDEVHVIPRDKFFTSEEEGFVQCTLGEWESAIKNTDDVESGDEGEEYGIDGANAQDLDDSALPPSPPPEDFEDLSVRAQLAYVKPVLRAILVKEYTPAREKHEAFMRGGSARVALLKSAGVRGGMDARFVRAVQKVICEWVLGETGVRPKRLDIRDVITENSEVEGDTSAKIAPPDTVLPDISPRDSMQDDKMEGIESAVVPEDVHANKNGGTASGALPTTTDKRAEVVSIAEMALDGREQDMMSLPPPANCVTLSPAIQQAALAPKSQLDLLAEVSQAVATEPSLLPSHPELPKLKVQSLDIPKDTSSLPSPLTPVPEEGHPLPPWKIPPVVCEEFGSLGGVEKLDYCLNVLLPEAVQQLLLWRSGERTSSALLSPEEEQRLHGVGARKAVETDWVDDVMRLRAAQARLWGVGSNKKAAEKSEVVQGGTRSRPRRATVSKP